MLIDFHTHAFPEKLSQKAMEGLSYASGGLKPQSKGTVLSLKQEMEKDGVDISVVLSIATNPKQQTNVNNFAKELNDKKSVFAFGSVHPDADKVLDELERIKDMGLKEPYVGQCQLQTGEIAEDLTYYFATSEQTPSAVGLGVLVDKDGVKQAGGFIIQLMPFTSDEVIDKLENRLQTIESVTNMLERGLTPEGILEEILGEMGLEINDTMETQFYCDCSKEKVSRALSTINKKDLDDIINDGESIEIKCQFCNKAYTFEIDELKEIRKV
jgi:molecular chaperone Hsp33